MSPLLEIENLSVDFRSGGQDIPAVSNISLTVNRGELLALVGESGSGKSVTALSVLQLLPIPPARIRSGKIIFHGQQNINLLSAAEKALEQIRGNKIAMIFQEPMTSLNPVMSCGKQVSEALLIHKKISPKKAKKEAIDLFLQVELPQPELLYDRFPHQLSGGQKQRVMIAMAMSCSPDLLICDEPTTALDVTVQKSILQLIKKIQRFNNMGVLFISHDLGVVAEIADSIVVMYKGKIVEKGTSGQIFKHPGHPYTRALLACRPALHTRKERLPVVSDFMEADPETGDLQNSAIPDFPKKLPAQNNIPLLAARNLCVHFPVKKNFFGKTLQKVKAVENVSFEIFEGETVGLVGGSGSGKTTLGRTLLYLITPTAGTILYGGRDIASFSEKERRNWRKEIQIIFQDPYSSLDPRQKIGDAIAEPLRVHHPGLSHSKRTAIVYDLLRKVNLREEHYYRYPHEFSGGQRQRVVIARALVLQPSLIVCDESISALDVSVQAQIINLLNDLKKEYAFTTLFISHDLSVVRYISDRIIVMHKGEIIESGAAEEICLNPRQEYTRELLSAIPGRSISGFYPDRL